MLRPMFLTDITLASWATHGGGFAQLSCRPHTYFRIGRRLLRNANLTAASSLSDFHSRTACWPFTRLGLLLDPPVWMSDTTSHLVETEEAPFAVARDPVVPRTASDIPTAHFTQTSNKKLLNHPITRIPHSNTTNCTSIMRGNHVRGYLYVVA